MTKFAIAFAAAGLLLAAPSFTTTPAAAQDVQLRIGTGDGPRVVHRDRGYRAYGYRSHYRDRDRCRTTVVIKDGRRTVIKRCRD